MSTDPLLGKDPVVKRPGFIGSIINRVKGPLKHEADRKNKLITALANKNINEALRLINDSGLTGPDFNQVFMAKGHEYSLQIIPYIIKYIPKAEDRNALVKALIDKGIDVSEIVKDYDTYNNRAILETNAYFILYSGNRELIDYLIDHIEKVIYDNDKFFNNITDSNDTFFRLVSLGLNVNKLMKNGNTPFLYMLKKVVSLENETEAELNKRHYHITNLENSPEYVDFMFKSREYYHILNLMIEKGANLNESAMDIAKNLKDEKFKDFLNKQTDVNEVKVNPNANGNKATNPLNLNAPNAKGTNAVNDDGQQLPGAVNGGKRRKTRKSTKSRKLRSRKFKKSRKLRSRKSKI